MPEKALRILVIGNLPPYVLGGAENQVARLVEAWAIDGAHVEVAGHCIPSATVPVGQATIRVHHLRPWTIGGGRGEHSDTYFPLPSWRCAVVIESTSFTAGASAMAC